MGGAVGNIVSGIGDAVGGAVQGVSDLVHDVGQSPIVQTALPIVATAVGGPAAGAATSAALVLDQGKSMEQALTNAAINYAAGQILSPGTDQLGSMEAGIDWGTPDFASMTPSDLSSLEAGIDWGSPSLTAMDKGSLANAFTTGASAVGDWVMANPVQAAALGLTAAKAMMPATTNGVSYTPVNWDYLAPQFNPSVSNIIPSTYQMPETMQQGLQRNVQLGQDQIIDPTVLAAQAILNKPLTYRTPTSYQPQSAYQSPAVAQSAPGAYVPLVQPSQVASSGKGGVNGMQIPSLLQNLL